MTTVQTFLTQLGGAANVARELGIPYTTVVSWRDRNSIPEWRMPAIAGLAIKSGVDVPATFASVAA